MTVLRLTKITSTIKIYGQCAHPRRLRGTFSIEGCGSQDFEIFEGHVNRMEPQRLLVFDDSSDDWSMSAHFQAFDLPEVVVCNESERIRFFVERVDVRVLGRSDKPASSERYRGSVRPINGMPGLLNVYEANSNGDDRFYLDGAREVLLEVRRCIHESGECLLTDELLGRE